MYHTIYFCATVALIQSRSFGQIGMHSYQNSWQTIFQPNWVSLQLPLIRCLISTSMSLIGLRNMHCCRYHNRLKMCLSHFLRCLNHRMKCCANLWRYLCRIVLSVSESTLEPADFHRHHAVTAWQLNPTSRASSYDTYWWRRVYFFLQLKFYWPTCPVVNRSREFLDAVLNKALPFARNYRLMPVQRVEDCHQQHDDAL